MGRGDRQPADYTLNLSGDLLRLADIVVRGRCKMAQGEETEWVSLGGMIG